MSDTASTPTGTAATPAAPPAAPPTGRGKVPMLDLAAQYRAIAPEIQTAIARVLETGRFILGPEVAQFENEVAAYLGVKHAIGVNSGTDALTIGLRALGVGPGDEVITTPFSFFATAESISNVGATPVFADVDARSFNLDPEHLRAALTPRAKAIVPVHLYGRPAAMAQILDIAADRGIPVLEDCAQSFGARYAGTCSTCDRVCRDATRQALSDRHTGTLGAVGAFSFFPTKNLGAYGDGGLIATDSDAIAELASKLRVHGSAQKYRNELLGYNSRLDALQAAILGVKLRYVEQWNLRRREIAARYGELLAAVPGIILPEIADGHVFHQYTLRVLDGRRDWLREQLAAAGVATMVYYPVPQDRLPVYRDRYPAYPVSDRLAAEVLSLPIWPEMSDAALETVAAAIAAALQA